MNKYTKSILGVFLIFFLFGLVDAYRSVLLPEIQDEFHLSYQLSSLIFFLSGLGYIIGNLLGGELGEKFKKKISIYLGIFLILGMVILITFVDSYYLFLFYVFIIGVGQGILNTISNIIITGINIKNKGGALSRLHSFYGVGSLMTPLIIGQLLAGGMQWRNTFILLAGIYAASVIFFTSIKLPEKELEQENLKNKKGKISIFKSGAYLFFLCIFFYMGSEVGLSAWLITYLQRYQLFSVELSSIYLTVFFVCLTAGRLLGSFFIDRFHYLKSSIFLLAIVFILLVAGFFLGKGFLIFLSITGLFYGTVYPNITIALKNKTGATNRIMGIFLAFSSLGAMALTFFIGFLMDMFDVHQGMLSILIFTLVTIMLIAVIDRKKDNLQNT